MENPERRRSGNLLRRKEDNGNGELQSERVRWGQVLVYEPNALTTLHPYLLASRLKFLCAGHPM
jgi:hypothetical protein